MTTPVSTSSPYCTPQQLLLYHDARQLGELVSDTNVPLLPASVLSSPIVAELLLEASGEVESYCFRGGRYAPADLLTLTGASAALLRRLVADLAFWHGTKRRYRTVKLDEVPGAKEAHDTLALLEKGERIFGLQEAARSGLPDTEDVTETDRQRLLLSTSLASRFFGVRGDRYRGAP